MRLKAILITLGVMFACIGIFYGWQGLKTAMFTQNPQYEIKKLDISKSNAVKEQEVIKFTGISEGVNLFSFSAAEKRRKLLESVPNLSDVRIVKTLPDKVKIAMTDRLPVLRLGDTDFAADKDGTVMTLDWEQKWAFLPKLFDSSRKQNPVPGQKLEGKAAQALAIANVYNEMDGISFKLNGILVDARFYVILQTAEGRREIRLVWEELTSRGAMRKATSDSKTHVQRSLPRATPYAKPSKWLRKRWRAKKPQGSFASTSCSQQRKFTENNNGIKTNSSNRNRHHANRRDARFILRQGRWIDRNRGCLRRENLRNPQERGAFGPVGRDNRRRGAKHTL